MGFPWWHSGKETAYNVGATEDEGLIPGSERSPGGEYGNPLQYFCLENPMNASSSLTMLSRLTVWIKTNWKILKEREIPDHLTCLLTNLYAGKEATVRTGHGTTDWFKIGKGI